MQLEYEKYASKLREMGFSLLESMPLYRDTDSLLFWGNNLFNDWMKSQMPSKKTMGKMWWDLKGETKIIRVVVLAPKTYMFVYALRDTTNSDKYKICYKMRSKGIPSRLVTTEMFDYCVKGLHSQLINTSDEILHSRGHNLNLFVPAFRDDTEKKDPKHPRNMIEKKMTTIKKVISRANAKESENNRLALSMYNNNMTRYFFQKFYDGRDYYRDAKGQWYTIPWELDQKTIDDDLEAGLLMELGSTMDWVETFSHEEVQVG